MLIILEGPDGAGKTTLAQQLGLLMSHDYDELPEIRHFGPPSREATMEYIFGLKDYVPGQSESIICDRYHVGELIYGPLYRGKSELAGERFAVISEYLNALGAVIVHVNRPHADLAKSVDERGDDYIEHSDIVKISKAYHKHFMSYETYPLPKFYWFDFKGRPHDILDAARRREIEVSA